jgi:hypothetical protein
MDPEVKTRFKKLTQTEKQYVLANVIHLLTISARDLYDVPDPERARKLEEINEVIHTASGKLAELIADSAQYPDDVFIDILYEVAGDAQGAVSWAIETAFQAKGLTRHSA